MRVDDLAFFIDIVYIDIIDPVIEVSHIQSQTIVIYKLYIVHLFVDILVSTWWHLSLSLPSAVRRANWIVSGVLWSLHPGVVRGYLVLPTLAATHIFKIIHVLMTKTFLIIEIQIYSLDI